MADEQNTHEAKSQKSRVRYLIPIILLVVVPALGFLAYDLVKPLIDPCESLFRQTQISLDSKVSWLKSEGQLQLKPEKIQELSERAQFVALNLKSCCLVLDSGKVSPEEFLQCKSSAFSFQQGLEKIVTLVKQQELHQQQPENTPSLELNAKLDAAVAETTLSSADFNQRIIDINRNNQYAKLKTLNRKELEIANSEAEPNDTILLPNTIQLGTWISAVLSNVDDNDYYQFTSPATFRDNLQIEIKNSTTVIAPRIDLYDQHKAHWSYNSNKTAGGDLVHTVLVTPATNYYLQITDYHHRGHGDYLFKVSALGSYDQFEPNDNIVHPSAIDIGAPISANIMDGKDKDFYSFTAHQTGDLIVDIQNQSSSIAPRIDLFNQQKAHVHYDSNKTAGGDIVSSIKVEDGQGYFLQVSDYHGSGRGEYVLALAIK